MQDFGAFDGMILTEESWSTQVNACPITTVFTTNSKWTRLGSNKDLRVEMPKVPAWAMARPNLK